MKQRALLLLAFTFLTFAHAAPAKVKLKCPQVVKPSLSIGPIKIGQSRHEIEKLGFKLNPIKDSAQRYKVDSLEIKLDDKDQVIDIGTKISETSCLTIDGHKLTPKLWTDGFAKVLPKCLKPISDEGGTRLECAGISIGKGSGVAIGESKPTTVLSVHR